MRPWIKCRVQQLIQRHRIDTQDSGSFIDQAFIDHVGSDAHLGLRRALAVAGLVIGIALIVLTHFLAIAPGEQLLVRLVGDFPGGGQPPLDERCDENDGQSDQEQCAGQDLGCRVMTRLCKLQSYFFCNCL